MVAKIALENAPHPLDFSTIGSTMGSVAKRIEDLLNKMRDSPTNVRFTELEKVCDHFFERRRSRGEFASNL